MEYYRVNSTGRRGRSLSSSGPPRPDTSGMSAADAQEAIKEWRVLRKAHTHKMQREHRMLFGSNAATEIEYSGVVDARLWLMSDVEVTRLLKGHTFPTKEILLIRIAEEANFSVALRLPLFEATTTRYTSGAVQDPCSRLRLFVLSSLDGR